MPDDDRPEDRDMAAIQAALANILAVQEHQDRGLKIITENLIALDRRLRDLENREKIKKAPAIVNMNGQRVI